MKIKKRLLGVLCVLFLLSISFNSKAACTNSMGEWIICQSDLLQFLQDAEENCDGEIIGDILILDCDMQ
jgi:hypothetical protein